MDSFEQQEKDRLMLEIISMIAKHKLDEDIWVLLTSTQISVKLIDLGHMDMVLDGEMYSQAQIRGLLDLMVEETALSLIENGKMN